MDMWFHSERKWKVQRIVQLRPVYMTTKKGKLRWFGHVECIDDTGKGETRQKVDLENGFRLDIIKFGCAEKMHRCGPNKRVKSN